MRLADAALPALNVLAAAAGGAGNGAPGPEAAEPGGESGVESGRPWVIGHGLELFRNVAGLPFPRSLRPDQAARLLARLETGLRGEFAEPSILARPGPAADAWLQAAGAMGMPAPWPAPSFSRFLLGQSGDRALLLNRDHHLQYLAYAPPDWGPAGPGGLLAPARGLFDRLAGEAGWATHPDHGFLCADPAWLGSGLRLRSLLCLPCLAQAPERLVVEGMLAGRLLRLVPWLPGRPAGEAWMVLETASCLGILVGEQLPELAAATSLLLHYERGLGRAADSGLADRAWRAWGILANARQLGADELLQLAVDLLHGLVQEAGFPPVAAGFPLLPFLALDPVVDTLTVAGGMPVQPHMRNEQRAGLVRSVLDGSFGR